MAKLTVGENSVDFLRWDGMQRFMQPFQAPFSEATLMVNFTSDKRFAKQRRNGYSLYLDTPDSYPVLGIIPIAKADGTGFVLRVTTHGISKKVIGSGGSTWGTEVKTFTNAATVCSWVFFYGSVYLCTGTNQILTSSDGTTWTNITTGGYIANATNFNYITVFQNRICLANYYDTVGANQLGSRLLVSRVGNGTDWVNVANDPASAQFYDIDVDHYGHIQGLFVNNNRLVIPKGSITGDMAIYRFDGSSILQVPTDVSIRPGGYATWVTIDGLGYFTNDSGVQEYGGDRPLLKSLALGDVNGAATAVAAGSVGKKYLVALGASITVDGRTLINPIIVYDRIAQEFFLYNTAHRMQAFATLALGSTAKPQLYSGDNAGHVFVWDGSNTDNGSVIHGEMELRPFFGVQYNNPMDFKRIFAYGNPAGNMHISLKNVGRTDWLPEVEMTDMVTELQLTGEASNANGVSFRLTCDTPGESPVFYGLSMVYQENPVN